MINKNVLINHIKKVIKGSVMDINWDYDDCRLENNGLIRKGCGYNQNYRFKVELSKKIKMETINWCNNNCSGKFGWYFDDVMSGRRLDYKVTRKTIFTFQKKYDCFNFKLKYL